MLKYFLVIIIFLVALSLFFAMSVGVAFSLVWIFPVISFEMGVLIGTVSVSMIIYIFIGITNALSNMHSATKDDDDILEKIYDEIDLDHVILPIPTRSRRKRR